MNFIKKDKSIEYVSNTNIIKVGKLEKDTKDVQEFYAVSPFPNFNEEKTLAELAEKVEKNTFLKAFKKNVGLGKKVLEVGCGTGQLSLVLAYGTNNMNFALDPTLASLLLGEDFAKKNKLKNCQFILGDIFDDPFQKDIFDFVWCSDVLHHTQNPRQGFKIIVQWLKVDGYIVIGLYNHIGRLRTLMRRTLYNFLGRGNLARGLINFIDPVLRSSSSDQQKLAWLRDQYEHPVESLHSLSEVLQWFEEENIEFISSIPSTTAASDNFEKLFERQSQGGFFSRILAETLMLFSTQGGEGGLFIVLGKKKSDNKPN